MASLKTRVVLEPHRQCFCGWIGSLYLTHVLYVHTKDVWTDLLNVADPGIVKETPDVFSRKMK